MSIDPTAIVLYKPEVWDVEDETHGGGPTGEALTIVDDTVEDLWDDVSGAEAATGKIEYRKVFVGLSQGTSGYLSDTKVWIASQPTHGDVILIKMRDDPDDDSNTLADIPPYTGHGEASGVWVKPDQEDDGVYIGTVSSTVLKGIWLCRFVPPSVTAGTSGFQLGISGTDNG